MARYFSLPPLMLRVKNNRPTRGGYQDAETVHYSIGKSKLSFTTWILALDQKKPPSSVSWRVLQSGPEQVLGRGRSGGVVRFRGCPVFSFFCRRDEIGESLTNKEAAYRSR